MDDLKYIKKYYGEKMMHLCRELFSTILEIPGDLSKLMNASFSHSKLLYNDIIDNDLQEQFKNYIYQKYENNEYELKRTAKTPQELMKKVGYDLYECHTEKDIQAFKKYYKPEEELCTFKGNRLNSCLVFFAIREDAEKLKREDFKKPRREDDYGISVISIQFSLNNHAISIKNRYNHAVINPDATYGNNLENIIPGLTASFEKKYGFKINQNNKMGFEIPNYTEVDGKLYKYNYEMYNTYYCPNNIIIKNGEIIQYPQEQYIIMDYFILDLKNKKLILSNNIHDGFIEEYSNIEKISIKKEKNKKKIIITTKKETESTITINNQNQIIEYENNKIKELEQNFMSATTSLKYLKLKNLQTIRDKCFRNSPLLEEAYLPNLKKIGNNCFSYCSTLKELYIPKLYTIGRDCFNNISSLKELKAQNLEIILDTCFCNGYSLEKAYLPNLKFIGNNCFVNSTSLKELNILNLLVMKSECFEEAKSLKNIYCRNELIVERINKENKNKEKQKQYPSLYPRIKY